ncbi:hypothetical protein GW17_00000872 [Ensete ventricosum]|nr:hypothetical protein GW17_00000872 [Ensete ventricosum]
MPTPSYIDLSSFFFLCWKTMLTDVLQGISYAKLANLPPIIGLCESLGLHEYICGRCRMHAKCVHLKRDYRFELRAASRVLGVGELEGSRSRSGVHCIPNNGVDAEASGEPEYGSLSLPSAGLHRHLLRGALPSVPGDPEVRTPFDLHPHDRCTIHSVIMDVLVLARLGFIIDFLSKATLVGFMAGAAIIVSLQQLKNLLGIVHFTKKMAVVPVLSSVFHNTHEIGKLKCGLNRPSWDNLLFDSTYLGTTMKTGLVTGIISLTVISTLAIYLLTATREIPVALASDLLQTHELFLGAFSRSAVNHNAGCKTAMSNVVMALTVMVTLLLLMPLFAYTPNVVLAAIIIAAVIGLIDVPAAYNIWKLDKVDFLVCMSSFLGVIFISVQEGLAIALTLVNPMEEVMEKLQRANKIHDFLGVNSLHLTIPEAVFSLSSQNKLQHQEVSSTLFI